MLFCLLLSYSEDQQRVDMTTSGVIDRDDLKLCFVSHDNNDKNPVCVG